MTLTLLTPTGSLDDIWSLDGTLQELVEDTEANRDAIEDCCCDVGCCEDDVNIPQIPPYTNATTFDVEVLALSGNSDCYGSLTVGTTLEMLPDAAGIWRTDDCLSDVLYALRLVCEGDELKLSWDLFKIGGSCSGPCPFDDSTAVWAQDSLQCDPFQADYSFTFSESETTPGSNPCYTIGCDSSATITLRLTKQAGSPP